MTAVRLRDFFRIVRFIVGSISRFQNDSAPPDPQALRQLRNETIPNMESPVNRLAFPQSRRLQRRSACCNWKVAGALHRPFWVYELRLSGFASRLPHPALGRFRIVHFPLPGYEGPQRFSLRSLNLETPPSS